MHSVVVSILLAFLGQLDAKESRKAFADTLEEKYAEFFDQLASRLGQGMLKNQTLEEKLTDKLVHHLTSAHLDNTTVLKSHPDSSIPNGAGALKKAAAPLNLHRSLLPFPRLPFTAAPHALVLPRSPLPVPRVGYQAMSRFAQARAVADAEEAAREAAFAAAAARKAVAAATSLTDSIRARRVSTPRGVLAPAAPTFPIKSVCDLTPQGQPCPGGDDAGNSTCTGTVTMTRVDADNCDIEYKFQNLSPGRHGFHIHEKADFSDGCMTAGPHYNPLGKMHGDKYAEERHVGNLGNFFIANEAGKSSGNMSDHLVKLYGPTSVLGQAIIMHGDFVDVLPRARDVNSKFSEKPPPNSDISKATGDAAPRNACGKIKLCCRRA